MYCRKCGAKETTRRAAGVFYCQHCGYQPGALRMDRSGKPCPFALPPASSEPASSPYVFAPREARLVAGLNMAVKAGAAEPPISGLK